MKNMVVMYGSKTVEHEVSIITALQFIENVDKEKFKVIPVYIDKFGKWYTGEELLKIDIYKKFDDYKNSLNEAYISPVSGEKRLVIKKKGILKKEESINIDVVVPAFHGVNGEDGTIQGLLELANIPYTSSGVLGCSVGMDKVVMKSVFKGNDFPVLPYLYFDKYEWKNNKEGILKNIEDKLKYPMFIKPANLGSSIGINKANNKKELEEAIEIACSYDRRIIVENGVENIKEINCSALGYRDEVEASVCEEPVKWENFLTFEDKYLGHGKGGKFGKTPSKSGMASLDRKIPADISEERKKEIEKMTIDIFKALDCKGVVRIDYIIDKDTDKLFVNEINIIPGSFAFYLWEPKKMKYKEMINKIVEYAIKENKEKNENIYSFNSDILNNMKKGIKK